jgi:hypothetical protein
MKQAKAIIPLLAVVVIALIVWLVLRSGSPPPSTTQSPTTPTPQWGVQTKTSGCVARGPLPDSACTPGAIFPDVTKTQVCTPGYASSVRDVPQSVKNKVYASYGITRHRPGQYEVDHLVSLQLGGSNAIANLWPEAASPKPGFHEKDKVENYLNYEVCSGVISLQQAQIEIATNWLTVYERLPKKQGLATPVASACLPFGERPLRAWFPHSPSLRSVAGCTPGTAVIAPVGRSRARACAGSPPQARAAFVSAREGGLREGFASSRCAL